MPPGFLSSLTLPCTLPRGRLQTQGKRRGFRHRLVFEVGGGEGGEEQQEGLNSVLFNHLRFEVHLRKKRTSQHFFSALTPYGL